MSERDGKGVLYRIIGGVRLLGKSPEEQAKLYCEHPTNKPQTPEVYVVERRLLRGGRFLRQAGDAGTEAINNVVDADLF